AHDEVERVVRPVTRTGEDHHDGEDDEEELLHERLRPGSGVIASSTARNPCASAPTGRPGRPTSFHAYTSKCAQAMPWGTKWSRKSAATIEPAKPLLPELEKSAMSLEKRRR